MNIAFAHSKGGVTKSAVASNLCVWLHRKGHNVAAIDLDAGEHGNKSLTTSVGQADPEIPVYQPEGPAELRELLPKLAEEFHFTVADAPGGFQSTAETNIELLKHSDFVLIPVKPEFDAIEPLSIVEDIIAAARRENPVLEARVIVNCLDGRTRIGKDPQGIVKLIHSICPELRVMQQMVRVDASAFQTARINGSVVVQGNRSPAQQDLNSLFAELLSDMIVSINRHSQQHSRTANG